jgi:hypothetical protein
MIRVLVLKVGITAVTMLRWNALPVLCDVKEPE